MQFSEPTNFELKVFITERVPLQSRREQCRAYSDEPFEYAFYFFRNQLLLIESYGYLGEFTAETSRTI